MLIDRKQIIEDLPTINNTLKNRKFCAIDNFLRLFSLGKSMDLCKPEFLKRMRKRCKFPVMTRSGHSWEHLISKGGNNGSFWQVEVEMGSHCTQADLKLTIFLSQPPACCDHRQAPPCPAFNLILINVTKSWESNCRGEEHVCSLQ